MPNTKTITGIQRGPDFDRDFREVRHVERIENEAKQGRGGRVNEPLIKAAVEAAHEVADGIGQRMVDVKYDVEKQMVIIQVLDAQGKEVVRQVPPEEMIRTAERIKKYAGSTFDQTM